MTKKRRMTLPALEAFSKGGLGQSTSRVEEKAPVVGDGDGTSQQAAPEGDGMKA